MIHQYSQILPFLFLSLLTLVSSQTCSSTGATTYSGFLEPYLTSAQFSQNGNSYFQISNPLYQMSLNQATIHFWAKITRSSANGLSQSGTLFDCSETMNAQILNDTLYANIASSKQNLTGQLIQQVGVPQLLQWNHIGITFSGSSLYFFLNGVQQGIARSTKMTQLNTSISTCTIGNSLLLNNSINALFRHFQFTKTSLFSFSASSLAQYIHSIAFPGDANLIAYYSFGKNFNFQDTYYQNQSRQYSQSMVQMVQSSEPEFVCYCTGTYPNFLKISNQSTLQNQTLTFANKIDTNGFTLTFIIYPYQVTQIAQDQLLYSISNYANITLAANGQTLRLDILSSTGSVTSFNFTGYTFVFNYWSQIQVNLTKTTIQLTVNNTKIQSFTHKIILPASSTLFFIQAPQNFSILIYSLTLQNYKNLNAYNQSFWQSDLSNSTLTLLSASPSSLQFDSVSTACILTSPQTNLWSGTNCQNNQFVPAFNGQNPVVSDSLLQNMVSSQSSQTIELWLKDKSSTANGYQVLFENSLDGVTPNIQIGIQAGLTTAVARNITCFINKSNYIQFPLVFFNSWIHFSCISDQMNFNSRVLIYTPTGTSDIAYTSNGLMFFQQPLPIPTSIGSSVNGQNKFTGLLKQIRIWNITRSDLMIQTYRFQSFNANSYSSQGLQYYYRLDDQFNPLKLQDAFSPNSYFLDSQSTSPIINYGKDSSFIICEDGYFYAGTCCIPLNIQAVNFKIQYSAGTNQVQVFLDSSTVTNSYLKNMIIMNFTVLSVGNNFQAPYQGIQMSQIDYLNIFFNQSMTQSFNVSSILINPLAYNITIQAMIYTNLQPTTIVVKNQTLTLTCPMVYLTIIPGQSSDSTQIVSQTSNSTDPIVSAFIQNQCYNPSNNTQTQINVTSISWAYNISSTVSKTAFLISNDSTSVSTLSKTSFKGTSSYVQFTATVLFSNKQKNNAVANVNFQPAQINLNGLSSQTPNVLAGTVMSVDLSSASSTNSTLYPFIYQVNCPQNMFASYQQYLQLCQIGSNGKFSLDTSQIQVFTNQVYYFSFYIILNNTSIFQQVNVTVKFVMDGGNLPQCPTVTFNSVQTYNFNVQSNQNLSIVPNVYQYCNGVFYNLLSMNWTAFDYYSGANISQVLSVGIQQIYMIATLTQSQAKTINSGSIINVTLAAVFQQGQSPSIIIQNTTMIQLSQRSLSLNIQPLSKNGLLLTNNSVNFIEPSLVLNSSTSYDPDNSTQVLSYYWNCPDIVQAIYDCQSLVSGVNGQILTINALKRAKIGFTFGQKYNFTAIATNTQNPYKLPMSQIIQIVFNAPQNTDNTKISSDLKSNCSTLQIPLNQNAVMYVNLLLPTVLKYDLYNASLTSILITFNNTMLCTKGQIVEQSMFIYTQNTQVYSNSYAYMIADITGNFTYFNYENFYLQNAMQLSQAITSSYYQASVYLFTQRYLFHNFILINRDSSPDQLELEINNFSLFRNPVALIAQFNSSFIEVDKYATLTLDASSSFDPDNSNKSYYFIWTCPVTTAVCSTQTGSKLVLKSSQRTQNLINIINATYNYSVVMSDGVRFSQPAIIQVQIIEQTDYSLCLSTQLNDAILDGYSTSLNNTLYVQYGQQSLLTIQMIQNIVCPSITLMPSVFYTQNNLVFWTNSTQIGVINLSPILMNKYLTAGQTYTIYYTQAFYLGDDSLTLIYTNNWINVQLVAPNLVPQISAPQITNSLNIVVDGSASYDPMGQGITFKWTCPSYFGGSTCSQYSSSSGKLLLSMQNLISLANTTNLSQFYNQSHQFVLQVASIDGIRFATQSQYVYIASNSSKLAFIGNTNCGIYQTNYTGLQLTYYSYNMFQFNCSGPTNGLTSSQQYQWSISGLQSSYDYFQYNNQLFLKPFRNYQNADELYISLVINGVNANPIQRSFQDQLPYLGNGQIQYSPTNFNTMFTQSYQIMIQYAQAQNTGLQFQLRGFMYQYNCDHLFYPIMPLTEMNQQSYLSTFQIPYLQNLYIDFYDMNSFYLGSEQLIGPQSYMYVGQYDQQDFENMLFPLTSKTPLNYSKNQTGMTQFEVDIQSLKLLSEALSLDIVSYPSDSNLQNYRQNIIQYLCANYFASIPQYSGSTYQLQAKSFIQKKIVNILANTLNASISIQSTYLNQTISMLENIMLNYSQWSIIGDAQESLRDNVIFVFQTLAQLVPSVPQVQQSGLTNRLKSLLSASFGSDLSNLLKGIVVNKFSSFVAHEYLLLQSNLQTPVVFNSQINQQEQVLVQNQQQISQLGVNFMEVAYQPQQNESSPALSSVFVNAYDQNYNKMSLAFQQFVNQSVVSVDDQNNSIIIQQPTLQTYITLQMQVAAPFMNQFQLVNTQFNDYQYQAICVYYNTTNSQWQSDGVLTLGYNQTTGIINCSAYHLTQFSIDYYSAYPFSSPLINNSSNQSQPQAQVQVQSVISYYFAANTGYYAAVVAISAAVSITFFLIGLCQRTKWDEGDPQISSMERNHSLGSIMGAAFLLNSIMISSFFGPSKGNYFLTMPKYVKMILQLKTFFFIAGAVALVMVYSNGSFSTWTGGQLAALGAILIASVMVYRIITVNLYYYLHFKLLPKKNQLDFENVISQKPEERSQKYQYEGGEEDNSMNKSANKNNFQQNKLPQVEFSQAKKSTQSDIQLDEFDMEIASQPKNQFFNAQKNQGMNKPGASEKIVVTRKNNDKKENDSHKNSDEEGGKINTVNRLSNVRPSEQKKEKIQSQQQIINKSQPINEQFKEPPQNQDKRLHSGKISEVQQPKKIESERQVNETQMQLNKTDIIAPNDKSDFSKPIQYSDKTPIQACSLIIGLILLIAKMVIAYLFMWFLPLDFNMVKHWFGSILGIYFILVLILDPLFVILYSMIFSCLGPYSNGTKAAGIILIGNGHANVANGILYHLNQK